MFIILGLKWKSIVMVDARLYRSYLRKSILLKEIYETVQLTGDVQFSPLLIGCSLVVISILIKYVLRALTVNK